MSGLLLSGVLYFVFVFVSGIESIQLYPKISWVLLCVFTVYHVKLCVSVHCVSSGHLLFLKRGSFTGATNVTVLVSDGLKSAGADVLLSRLHGCDGERS